MKWQMIKLYFSSVHSPGPIRVVGPLSNSREFAAAYKCKPGSRMNPRDKCSVWWKPASARITSTPWGPQTDCKPQVRGSRDKSGRPPPLPPRPRLLQSCFLASLLQVQRKGPPLYIGWAFDVLYFISDVDAFRVEGKYQFMTEKVISRLVVACLLLGANSRSW